MILADEGLNGNIVRFLRAKKFEVEWILEISPGIKDEQVIEYGKENKKILITEDKDFGEWIFSHKVNGLTIVFLRYEKVDFEQILIFLEKILSEIISKEDTQKPEYEFITINRNKVRRRFI